MKIKTFFSKVQDLKEEIDRHNKVGQVAAQRNSKVVYFKLDLLSEQLWVIFGQDFQSTKQAAESNISILSC